MIFASNNQGKINEIKKIFKNQKILSLKDVNIEIDILENGNSYYENALIKAKKIYELTGIPTIADDSGLEILGLKRWPGINTHRISEDDNERNMIFLNKTKDLEDKRIETVCTLVYVDKSNIIDATVKLKGNITDKIYEVNGFGFDKIFRLEKGKVVSNLTNDEKNKISARSQAAKILLKKLEKMKLD